MKDKKVKYILIGLVLLIWGIIIFKIFHMVKPVNNEAESSFMPVEENTRNTGIDSFMIIPDYPDPFLKKYVQTFRKQSLPTGNTKKSVLTNKASEAVKWPNLTYSGYASANSGNKSSVLIIIDGTGYIMKVNDEVKGVEMLAISKDSVKVKFSGISKFVKRYERSMKIRK